MMALVVRPAVHDDAAHGGHQRRVGGRAVELEDAVYAAHRQNPYRRYRLMNGQNHVQFI